MSWLSFLKIKPKTVDDIFDKEKGLLTQVGGWIGNSNFTSEESAEINLDIVKSVQTFVSATLEESTDRSKARRDIAVFFIKFYALMLFMCGMTFPISAEWSAVWFNLSTSLAVGGLVTSISIFFFGSHGLTRINNSKSKQ